MEFLHVSDMSVLARFLRATRRSNWYQCVLKPDMHPHLFYFSPPTALDNKASNARSTMGGVQAIEEKKTSIKFQQR